MDVKFKQQSSINCMIICKAPILATTSDEIPLRYTLDMARGVIEAEFQPCEGGLGARREEEMLVHLQLFSLHHALLCIICNEHALHRKFETMLDQNIRRVLVVNIS